MKQFLVLVALLTATFASASAERIKDIVDIQGVRSNPLWGYGLVVGLNGTGDNSESSKRALTNILRRSGLVLDPTQMSSKNIASVLVTAELPPFGRKGGQVDVTVSAIGDSSSLVGGTLLMTPLMGADGSVYAVAQGPLSVGGFAATGQTSSVSKNHPTVGEIPAGATIEKEELADFTENGQVVLHLRNPDFTTADRIAQAINAAYRGSAVALDGGTIRVTLPDTVTRDRIAAFIDAIGAIEIKVDYGAVVVINEKSGTIVVGENVSISTVAISHGNLSIVTQEKDYVSQTSPFARVGQTEKTHRTDIDTVEDKGALHVVTRKVSVQELAQALNAMGLTPRDLISIFKALRQAGALQAQLKIV